MKTHTVIMSTQVMLIQQFDGTDQVSSFTALMQESVMEKAGCAVHFWSICILSDDTGETTGNELLIGVFYVAIKVLSPES